MWNVFSIESEFFRFELEIWFIEMSFSVGAMANGLRMEYNYGKAHDMGVDTEKQAEKPTLEANWYVYERKLGVGVSW